MLTTLFSRLVLTFGDQPLPYRTVVEELVLGFILVVPFGVFLGHATQRWCCRSTSKYWRADLWNTTLRLFVADVTMELLLPSIRCLPLNEDVGYSLGLLMQHYGMYCPDDHSERRALSPTATGIIFAMRLLLIGMGVHIGEAFAPIAVTGNIACGKSTVARLLTQGGRADDPTSSSVIQDGSVYLVDTDTIAHEILLPNTPDSVYQQVVEVFGPDNILQENDDDNDTDSFLMNENSPPLIDRRKLGNIVFQDSSKRRQLNSITHPRIMLVMLKRMLYGLYLGNKDLVVVDVPLLYETGKLSRLFCMTILVMCSAETQLDRLQSRNPELTKQQCQQRIASQMDMAEKAKLADILICNEASYKIELETQVENARQAIMNNIYGVGLSLLQLLIIIGGSVPLAVLSKLYTLRANSNQD